MTKKEQVISAARNLFSEYGYHKVSMDEIAKVSGVTKRTIYTYFKDKNDLIKFFLYEELNTMRDMVNKIDDSDIPFNLKIREMIMTLIEYRTNSKLVAAFYKEDSKAKLKIADECADIFDKAIQKEIKVKLERAIKDGFIKDCDPDITAFIIYKIYIALMFDWDKPLDKKDAADKIMNILETGLLS